ncbi:uncharacterized protein LOC121405533 [Drosophila obscura]|uniref:uncharacterized protein LOC121405533 n=1 Tax=Drosophila obscura TaxID=7282 RepID=UPI001BB16588|nr:uncharacterized protein LOC121405533 [Drosophila obscura]
MPCCDWFPWQPFFHPRLLHALLMARVQEEPSIELTNCRHGRVRHRHRNGTSGTVTATTFSFNTAARGADACRHILILIYSSYSAIRVLPTPSNRALNIAVAIAIHSSVASSSAIWQIVVFILN